MEYSLSVDCERDGPTAVGSRRTTGGRQAHFHIFRYFRFYVIVFVIQKLVVFRDILSIFIATFIWQQLYYKQSPISTQKFQKKIFLFVQKHMKKTSFVKSTASPLRREDVFLPACKFHIILFGEIEELLHKLETFSFTYQHVDCLSTLFKYRLSGKVIEKSGNMFDIVQRAISFNQRNRGVGNMPSIAKKKFCEKSLNSIL